VGILPREGGVGGSGSEEGEGRLLPREGVVVGSGCVEGEAGEGGRGVSGEGGVGGSGCVEVLALACGCGVSSDIDAGPLMLALVAPADCVLSERVRAALGAFRTAPEAADPIALAAVPEEE